MTVGFIGLGAMGQHMACNLHRAGLLTGAWNRTPSRTEALAAQTGCRVFGTPAELAAACDLVVTCVSADEDLLAVVDALCPALRKVMVIATDEELEIARQTIETIRNRVRES